MGSAALWRTPTTRTLLAVATPMHMMAPINAGNAERPCGSGRGRRRYRPSAAGSAVMIDEGIEPRLEGPRRSAGTPGRPNRRARPRRTDVGGPHRPSSLPTNRHEASPRGRRWSIRVGPMRADVTTRGARGRGPGTGAVDVPRRDGCCSETTTAILPLDRVDTMATSARIPGARRGRPPLMGDVSSRGLEGD